MSFDDNALIHDRRCFDRDTLAARLEILKFNSLARMELFLWDLENDKSLLKRINDFQSLYVRKELNRSSAEWAVIGAKIRLLLDYLSRKQDAKNL